MKKEIKIAILFVTTLAVILLASCNKSGERAAADGPAKHEQGRLKETKPGAVESLYQCPMHPTYVSDKPGDCPICGMKLVPVETNEKPAIADESSSPMKRVMYRSTMLPNEVSDKPGKDSMGMDMVPFEVEESGAVTEVAGRVRVKISPERQQLIGIKTASVQFKPIHKLIKAAGRVDYAEPNISIVTLKYDGWVEKLFVNSTGRAVRRGEPLFDIYSPELVAAEQEYVIALKSGSAFGDASSILKSAREKLRLWDISDGQLEEIARTGNIKKTATVYSPGSGIVIEKNVVQGQKVMSGENLFKIADLTRVWIIGEVYEYELPFIKTGLEVNVSLSYYPGESFSGRIAFIYPYLKPETRTNPIRIEAANPDLKLKPEMFANLEVHVDYGTKLTVPVDAVLDTGDAKIVFVAKPDGYFEPREVKLGVRGQDMVQVLGGVSEGEKVLTSANFFIDSESSLKAALSRLAKPSREEREHD